MQWAQVHHKYKDKDEHFWCVLLYTLIPLEALILYDYD